MLASVWVWPGARNASVAPRTRSRCLSVLVDQSAEQVVPVDAKRGGSAADEVWVGAVWRGELERAVRPVPVVGA